MADDDGESRVPQSILMAAVIVLTVISGMTALAQKAAQLGPRVGDGIVFDPAHPNGLADSAARVSADRQRRASCVLDVAIIQRDGGSLVVEQRGSSPDHFYHAHWAGHRTSEGGDAV